MEHEARAAFFRVALFGVYFWSFGGGALSIWSYAPKIFNCAPKNLHLVAQVLPSQK